MFNSLVQVVETGEPLKQEFYGETDNKKKGYYCIAVKFGDGFSITVRDIAELKWLEFMLLTENGARCEI